MGNLEKLKNGYQLFAKGDIEGVLAMYCDKIVWDMCTGLPYVKGDGRYVGKQAVVEGVFANIPEHYENFNIEIVDLVDGGDKIVMVGFYTGTWKASGKKFKANATHTWTFSDGKVSAFFQAVDTAQIINS